MSQTKKAKTDNASGKPTKLRVDEALKYLFTSEKQSLIRLINNALNENYDPDTTELVVLGTEFIFQNPLSDESEADSFDLERIIADMIFSLNGVRYHIEFQTNADKSIVIRIIGYGVAHARSNMESKGTHDEIIFELPVPVLIQIDEDESLSDKIPAKIRMSGREDDYAFEITVIRLWTYDIEELIKRGFYLLMPFMLMRHRKVKNPEDGAKQLIADLHKIETAITGLYEKKLISSKLRTDMHIIVNYIAQAINAKYLGKNQEIDEELKKMDAARVLFSNEVEARGIAIGEAIGEARGKAEGKAEGEAEVTQVIRLFVQKKTPAQISKDMKVPVKKVKDILRKSGLIEQSH